MRHNTMCNFRVRSVRFNSKQCKHPEFHAPKKAKSVVLRQGDGLLFMKCKGRFAVGLHWKGSDWCRGLLCWSPLTLRGANQAFQHEKMTGVVLLHQGIALPRKSKVALTVFKKCLYKLVLQWPYSPDLVLLDNYNKKRDSVVTVVVDLPESHDFNKEGIVSFVVLSAHNHENDRGSDIFITTQGISCHVILKAYEQLLSATGVWTVWSTQQAGLLCCN